MKKAAGLIVLLLAALLVAMPAAASTLGVFNGADALMLGTKIIVQEEVGGILAAENMAARAVDLSTAQAALPILTASASSAMDAAHYMRFCANPGSYKPTPGAGGDGFARFS
jgi:peptidoglycan/LPS O-acetylase OafA/YrhL